MPCAAHAVAVSERLEELGDNTDVVLITFTKPENLSGYQRANDLPFPILVDPDRSAYRAFGLGRGSAARVYGLRAARRYWDILRSGDPTGPDRFTGLRDLVRPAEDPLQLGGDFLVGPDGRLAYGFWGQGPDDRPSVEELIAAVAELGRP
ncbi:MAG: AhpC/TSA family protein [Acidimicrobiales bacterium]